MSLILDTLGSWEARRGSHPGYSPSLSPGCLPPALMPASYMTSVAWSTVGVPRVVQWWGIPGWCTGVHTMVGGHIVRYPPCIYTPCTPWYIHQLHTLHTLGIYTWYTSHTRSYHRVYLSYPLIPQGVHLPTDHGVQAPYRPWVQAPYRPWKRGTMRRIVLTVLWENEAQ